MIYNIIIEDDEFYIVNPKVVLWHDSCITDVSRFQRGIGKNIIHSKVVILRSSITHELEMKFRKSKDFTWLKENSRFITFFTKVDVSTTTDLTRRLKNECGK